MQVIGAILSRRVVVLLAATALALLGLTGVASAATFTVNDPTDAALATPTDTSCVSTDSDQCTLRAAVQAADNLGGPSTIDLPAGTYKLTIPSATSNDPSTGDLDVNSNDNGTTITVTGAGSGSTIINGNGVDRAFAVEYNVLGNATYGGLTLSGLTIEGGTPDGSSSGFRQGGAIYSDGALNVNGDVVFSGNSIGGCCPSGGAIYSDSDSGSTLSVTGATFDSNGGDQAAAIYDNSPNTASISNSTFSGGFTDGSDGGAIYGNNAGMTIDSSTFDSNSAFHGGAIYWNTGNGLTITTSSFSGNSATRAGGAIYSEGFARVTITTSSFSGNSANGDGGAIYDDGSDALSLTGDLFSGNSAPDGSGGALTLFATPTTLTTLNQDEFDGNAAGRGGALDWEAGQITSTGSSFIDNHADDRGGGLYLDNCCNNPQLTLVNATLSGNTADSGGGMYVNDSTPATLTNDTIAFNGASGGNGGGIRGAPLFELTNTNSPPQTGNGVENTIVADNSGGDCDTFALFSNTFDQGNNLDSDSSCFGGLGSPGDKTGVDPLLAHPADNGGPVVGDQTETIQTDRELAGSPAIDAGTNSGCPATDARAVMRPQTARDPCDMGAYESLPANLSVTKSAPSTITTSNPFTYAVTVTDNGPGHSTGTTVVDQLPAGETLWGTTPSQGSCTSSGSPAKLTCNLGTIDNGSDATVTIVASIGSPGTVTNSATATNDEGSMASGSATTNASAPSAAPSAAPTGTLPTALTGSKSHVSTHGVTLAGTVGTGGQTTWYFFQYGKTNAYGMISGLFQLSSSGNVSAQIGGLLARTKYHYRLVAINGSGQAFGGDETFRTKKNKKK